MSPPRHLERDVGHVLADAGGVGHENLAEDQESFAALCHGGKGDAVKQ